MHRGVVQFLRGLVQELRNALHPDVSFRDSELRHILEKKLRETPDEGEVTSALATFDALPAE